MKSTLLAGAGALVTGNTISATLSNAGRVAEVLPKNGGSAILTKKSTLGSGKTALKVSALSLGCMGMQGGPGITPDEKRMEKFIRKHMSAGLQAE